MVQEESKASPDPELPSSPLDKLRPSVIALACKINALLGHLEDEQGYAHLHVEIKRGIPSSLRVERSFKL